MTPTQKKAAIAVLGKKYGSPMGMIRAIGLDAEISEIEKMMAAGSGPYGGGDDEPASAFTKEKAEALLKAVRPHLDDVAFAELFGALYAMGLVDETSRGTSQAADMPPAFPGRPTPGGKMVPLEKRTAMDSASDAVKKFHERFPGADRIGHGVAIRPVYAAVSPRTDNARSDSFAKLFPGAERIGRVG